MFFINLLVRFLLGLLVSKDEYQINSKRFNPVRLVVTSLIIVYVIVVTMRLMEYRTVMEQHCKVCIIEVDK